MGDIVGNKTGRTSISVHVNLQPGQYNVPAQKDFALWYSYLIWAHRSPQHGFNVWTTHRRTNVTISLEKEELLRDGLVAAGKGSNGGK